MTRWFIASVLLISSAVSLTGQVQTPPKVQAPPKIEEKAVAEKLAKQVLLADQILADAQGLRLGENRAFVYARVGGMIWKTDKKTAQDIFQRSVGEMGNAQMLAEAEETRKSNQQDLRLMMTIRPGVLSAIGAFDAEFALESLYRTRTASIQRALAQSAEPQTPISDLSGMMSAVAQSELNLEQRLLRLAADQNPERAIKLLQDSLKKGLSNETLSLLQRLFVKEPELANSLAAETLDKLNAASFSTSPADQVFVNLSTSILNEFIRVKKPGAKDLKFEDMPIRSLANKLITYFIGQDPRYSMGRIPSMLKIAEKLAPGMVAALKKLEKSSTPPGAPNSDVQKLMQANLPAAQMIAEAKKLSADTRAPVIQQAANKMSQAGEINAAMELLNANFSGTALNNAVNSLNWWYAAHLMNQGKWAEAERMIDDFPESNKRAALMTLATRAFAKDAVENKTYALSVLSKVRAMLPDRPSDQTELAQFMQLTSAFAGIEVDEAFNCFDPIVPQLNELVDANAVVQGFQGNSMVRSGEFVLVNGGYFGFQFDQNVLRMLAKSDFDRTIKLIDSFTRREMRISLKMQLAETGLN